MPRLLSNIKHLQSKVGYISIKPQTYRRSFRPSRPVATEVTQSLKMKIACLQFDPKIGQVKANIQKADEILQKYPDVDIDLLVLPELAFSGYNFKTLEDIIPHLEDKDSGTTTLWAQATSRRLKCFTIAGYPELSADDNKRYNSCILVDPDGTIITNYRKTFLFQTDDVWASEGSGFFSGALDTTKLCAENDSSISSESINATLGCCMDLNPYKYIAPFEAYEFANHILANKSNLVIVPMAWLSSRPDDITDLEDPEIPTLRYWITRLQPLLKLREDREIIFITANRVGEECGVTYAGTSAVVGLKKGKVVVYRVLGVGEEDLMIVEVPIF